MQGVSKSKTSFTDILGADLTSKVIQTTEDIGVNLLKTLDGTRFQRVKQSAFKQVICLLFTLPINSIVAVGEPVQESIRTIGGIVLGQRLDALCV